MAATEHAPPPLGLWAGIGVGVGGGGRPDWGTVAMFGMALYLSEDTDTAGPLMVPVRHRKSPRAWITGSRRSREAVLRRAHGSHLSQDGGIRRRPRIPSDGYFVLISRGSCF